MGEGEDRPTYLIWSLNTAKLNSSNFSVLNGTLLLLIDFVVSGDAAAHAYKSGVVAVSNPGVLKYF